MPAMAAAQDILIEGRPGGMRLIPGFGGEGMAGGGADADHRLPAARWARTSARWAALGAWRHGR